MTQPKAAFLVLVVLACVALSAYAEDGAGASFPHHTVQQLDQAIAAQMQAENLPGVVVLVAVPGVGAYLAARGTANLATARPRDPHDPFRIASITKAFIGTAILQLVDQGRLRTSDPLSTWYPGFPHADTMTIGDLLRMRSGIADATDTDFFKTYYGQSAACPFCRRHDQPCGS